MCIVQFSSVSMNFYETLFGKIESESVSMTWKLLIVGSFEYLSIFGFPNVQKHPCCLCSNPPSVN